MDGIVHAWVRCQRNILGEASATSNCQDFRNVLRIVDDLPGHVQRF